MSRIAAGSVGECPCGSGGSFKTCCGPYLAGKPAPDALALMRSRYSAYVLADEAYLLATWHAGTRPGGLGLSEDGQPSWLGLSVKRHSPTGPDSAEVEFVARYRVGGRGHRMHEISQFLREAGCWYYVRGELRHS